MKTERHSWGPPTRIPNALVMPHKTERACLKCHVVKVTWHFMQGRQERYRTEFWIGLDKIECDGTPACEVIPALEKVA